MKRFAACIMALLMVGTIAPAVSQGFTFYGAIYQTVMNEIKIDSNDDVEWIEIYNPTCSTVDLDGWSLWYNVSVVYYEIYIWNESTYLDNHEFFTLNQTEFNNTPSMYDLIHFNNDLNETMDSWAPGINCTNMDSENSCARYRNVNWIPLDEFYEDSTPTKDAQNDLKISDDGPSSVISVILYPDSSYTCATSSAKEGDTVFVELIGTDSNMSSVGKTYVNVTSNESDPWGINVTLNETGQSSGIFRGNFTIESWSDQGGRYIEAYVGEMVNVTSTVDPTKNASVLVVNGGPPPGFNILPDISTDITPEDNFYSQQFWLDTCVTVNWMHITNASWLSWGSNNQTIYGTPDNGDVGWYNVSISASNGTASDFQNYTLTVYNTDPVINNTSLPNATEGVAYSVDLECDDEGYSNSVWYMDTNATWLNIASNTGVLSGTPQSSHVGWAYVNISANDGNGGWAYATYTLNVTKVNDPPEILSAGATSVNEDTEYSFKYEAMDPDDDILSWSFSSSAPFLHFAYDNQTLHGTPRNEHVGVYWVNVTVSDVEDAKDTHNFTLTVVNVNDAPRITSSPGLAAEALYEYSYLVVVNEVDVGDTLVYSLVTKPTGMNINPTGGLITWTPTEQQGGQHAVTVKVSDGMADDTQYFTITVTVPTSYPPKSTLLSPENGSTVNNTNPTLSWKFQDPDNATVYFDVYLADEYNTVKTLAPAARIRTDITQQIATVTTQLSKGATYYWTVIPDDGENIGTCDSGVWSFTVAADAVIEEKPVAALDSPSNGAEIQVLPVQLKWSGTDPDSPTIYYDVYLHSNRTYVEEHNNISRISTGKTNTSWLVTALDKGVNYYWTVVPNDGTNRGTCLNGIWWFKIAEVTEENRPPNIISTPKTTAYVGQTYRYQVNAYDLDEDKLSYGLQERPKDMVIDGSTGLVMWVPSAAQVGNHTVIVRVSDGLIYTEQTYTVEVLPESAINHPPQITSTPVIEATVGKAYAYNVVGMDLDADDVLEYSIVEGPQGMAIDSSSGMITWTPTKDQEGAQVVSIMVSDGENSEYHNFTITVAPVKVEPVEEQMPPWLLIVLVIIIVVVIAGIVASRRSRKKEEMPEKKEKAVKPRAAAVPVVTRRKKVVAKDAGVEYFAVEEVFLIYNDGRLIHHASTKDSYVDEQILSGMMVAIQSFVKDSFQGDEGEEEGLDSFEFSGRKIVMEKGNYIILSVALKGTEPPVLRERMRDIVRRVEGMYAGIVTEWDGDMSGFKGVEAYITPLFKLHREIKTKKKAEVVKLKSILEFYGGFVRVKVGAVNELPNTITDASFTLKYNRDALKFSHFEPALPSDGATVHLGAVKPGEKKSVACYLDPMICTESYIDGVLTYYDTKGEIHTVNMKRRPADIVCPIFYTPETINVAMLKRLVDKLKLKDSKIFDLPKGKSPQAVFNEGKELVQKHDVKFIREFIEQVPYNAEAWYYGTTKETDEELVIRVSVQVEHGVLEYFVASSNLATLTGLLAELGHGTNAELTSGDLEEAIRKSRSLLDKYAEAEMGADETGL
jgi:hypothetical protein